MSASERLREACILVLRKALFNRSVDARVTAVQGFLALCTRFTDPTLWNEITTSLQRCFSKFWTRAQGLRCCNGSVSKRLNINRVS